MSKAKEKKTFKYAVGQKVFHVGAAEREITYKYQNLSGQKWYILRNIHTGEEYGAVAEEHLRALEFEIGKSYTTTSGDLLGTVPVTYTVVDKKGGKVIGWDSNGRNWATSDAWFSIYKETADTE